MIRTLSRREPTCRTLKYRNLGERRSPTWPNGRYRPSSSYPAPACWRTRVGQREACRVCCQHHSKLRHAIPRSDLVTLSPILLCLFQLLRLQLVPLSHAARASTIVCFPFESNLLPIRLSAFSPLTPRSCHHCILTGRFVSHGTKATSDIACNTTHRILGDQKFWSRNLASHAPVHDCVHIAMGKSLQWRSQYRAQLLHSS
jgi:hypothetical protein